MKNIHEMNIIANDPNFTIVLPVGCNADCSFCSWRTSSQDKQEFNDEKFIYSLTHTLENLPYICTQITISGGEPSTYKGLQEVMSTIAYHKRKNIKKVVFTTNGQNILNLSKQTWFTNVVDFVNISRHDSNQEDNDRIMAIKTITWDNIKKTSKNLAKQGIPTNINCVLSDSITTRYSDIFLKGFIKACRKNFINSITFRRDYDDGFGIHPLETLMGKPTIIGECPVCRKSRYIVDGLDVIFTTSEFEPKDILGDNIYEFVLQPNGDLTTNWEGTDVIDLMPPVKQERPKKTKSITDVLKEHKEVKIPVKAPTETFSSCGSSSGGISCG